MKTRLWTGVALVVLAAGGAQAAGAPMAWRLATAPETAHAQGLPAFDGGLILAQAVIDDGDETGISGQPGDEDPGAGEEPGDPGDGGDGIVTIDDTLDGVVIDDQPVDVVEGEPDLCESCDLVPDLPDVVVQTAFPDTAETPAPEGEPVARTQSDGPECGQAVQRGGLTLCQN